MQTETILYIIIAGILALLLALFQYIKGRQKVSKLNLIFSFLRFVTLFSVFLLLINPKFEQLTLTTEKPNLVIAVDNSSSIKHLKQDENALNVFDRLSQNKELSTKFNISKYTFGEQLNSFDSIGFSEKQTNISDAFSQLSEVYKDTNTATILISDGNQTYGNDYEFITSKFKSPIYPIILGDTVTHTDLKIQQLNVNKYAYLKNRFPIETIISYNGNNPVNSRFVVTQGNTTVYSQTINFTKNNNSKTINFTLPANRVGVRSFKATIIPIENEKNIINNSKNFAVEVIDQKTKIAIVSNFPHPDLGALKKSIESNEHRSVVFLNSNEIISQIDDFQLIIINQPNNNFKDLFDAIDKENKNRFIIVGTKTDLNFVNRTNENFNLEITNQTEDYQAELNLNYSPFIVDDIDFESFPPLKSNFGAVEFSIPFETILNKKLGNVSTNQPLLVSFEANNRREAILFGENIWQWRAQSFINTKSFNAFDNFIGKLVQYLASNKRRNRLNVEYESFYNGNTNVIIKAQFFDKNYAFDTRETLNIIVKDRNSDEEKTFPLILKNNAYQVDLSSLPPSEYNFTVKATNENISKSGSFQILEYNIEQQFLNANVVKLNQLAMNSGGASYFVDDSNNLINNLLSNNRYASIQKSHKNIIPLVDWKYLLIIIALSLALEWFLRKYNGLI
ncbi:VWA domain-containing protein [Hwangdonia lutea]|uniref:VWA domain-containing protein n=1 Tax=Hwangdonia lutea TaxID=3075823 RepID=A0AA97EKW6_9FLAO|nr:VWA domain-containing protein [Hwangdonia sp. SCSIO 19198]WOD43329.1 VWA domain-containing protein [Hwangdonia sp. SCSIO 19198]